MIHFNETKIDRYSKKAAYSTVINDLTHVIDCNINEEVEEYIDSAIEVAGEYGIDFKKGKIGMLYQKAIKESVEREIDCLDCMDCGVGAEYFEEKLEKIRRLGKKYEVPLDERKLEEIKKIFINEFVRELDEEIRYAGEDEEFADMFYLQNIIEKRENLLKKYSKYIETNSYELAGSWFDRIDNPESGVQESVGPWFNQMDDL